MKLWDFFSPPDRNEIVAWARKERLTHRDRAKLNQKLDMLVRLGFEEASRLDFLDGPIRHGTVSQKHIYKLVIHSDHNMRPMLCKGPVAPHIDATLVQGAFEDGHDFVPWDAPNRAERNRKTIVDQAQAGREFRITHERF